MLFRAFLQALERCRRSSHKLRTAQESDSESYVRVCHTRRYLRASERLIVNGRVGADVPNRFRAAARIRNSPPHTCQSQKFPSRLSNARRGSLFALGQTQHLRRWCRLSAAWIKPLSMLVTCPRARAVEATIRWNALRVHSGNFRVPLVSNFVWRRASFDGHLRQLSQTPRPTGVGCSFHTIN